MSVISPPVKFFLLIWENKSVTYSISTEGNLIVRNLSNNDLYILSKVEKHRNGYREFCRYLWSWDAETDKQSDLRLTELVYTKFVEVINRNTK